MEFYGMEVGEVLREVVVCAETGLSTSEANARLAKFGKNQFTPPAKESIFTKILVNLKEPLIIILIVSGIISIAMGHGIDGIGIFAAVIISTMIAVIQEGKSDKAFEKLSQQSDDIRVKVLRSGQLNYVPKTEITIGDIIHLEVGDKVPADGRIIDDMQLKINESMLTGEADAVSKNSKVISGNAQLADRKNMVYSGTLVIEGRGTLVVTEIGDNTEMGKIASELKETLNTETPLQEKLSKLGKNISIVGTIAAGVVFLYEIYRMYAGGTLDFERIKDAFVISVALIVAAVPEGLPTMVALTLAFNMQKMAKHQALVRKMIACETIGSINVICSDKTGTLTQNKMTVTDVWFGGKTVPVDRVEATEMLHNICINSTADITPKGGSYEFVGNPTECSMLVCAKKNGVQHEELRKNSKVVVVYNFSSYRKMMSTAVAKDEGYRLYTKGSPERVLSICSKALLDGHVVNMNNSVRGEIEHQIKLLQDQAKRIISFAYRDTPESTDWSDSKQLECDLTFVGFVGIEDPLRSDVKDAVMDCRKAGISVKMLTGDNINTSRAIASQLGIIEKNSLVLEAYEIETLSDEKLSSMLDRIVVIARSTPSTKMRVVTLLKAKQYAVAVTGDGIKDAPALKTADVGVAMGVAGTEVSKEASDIVLLDDSFSTIVKSVAWGRGIYENFQRFIQFQLTVNVVAFSAAFLAEICGFGLPFTTLQLLWVNIIMDGPPALSLGLEPPRDHLLNKQPIPRNASIITRDMLFRIITNGAFIVAAILILMRMPILGGTPEQQSTIVFCTFVLFQLWNAFNCREFGTISVFTNILKNKLMIGIIAVTLGIQILITQFGGAVFKTQPLELEIWLHILVYTFSVVIFNELVKLLVRIAKSTSNSLIASKTATQ